MSSYCVSNETTHAMAMGNDEDALFIGALRFGRAVVRRAVGGSSTAEYGTLLQLAYPNTGNKPQLLFEDFRQVLSSKPCPQSAPALSAQASNQ